MPICPKCFEEIDRLDSMTTTFRTFHLDEQGKPVYGESDLPDHRQYFCPNCHTTLAIDEEEAIRTLKDVAIKN